MILNQILHYESPSITDWIQALGTLIALPTAAWGIIKLFVRNKEKDAEITALKNLANAQVDAVIQMEQQVQELKYQSLIFKDSNELLKEQIRIQTEVFINDQNYKEKAAAIQLEQRKIDNKPHFIFTHGGLTGSTGQFSMVFKNVGKRALFKEIPNLAENLTVWIQQPQEDLIIDANKELTISGTVKNNANINLIDFYFSFVYSDIDGVRYEQKFQRANGKFLVSIPNELKS